MVMASNSHWLCYAIGAEDSVAGVKTLLNRASRRQPWELASSRSGNLTGGMRSEREQVHHLNSRIAQQLCGQLNPTYGPHPAVVGGFARTATSVPPEAASIRMAPFPWTRSCPSHRGCRWLRSPRGRSWRRDHRDNGHRHAARHEDQRARGRAGSAGRCSCPS